MYFSFQELAVLLLASSAQASPLIVRGSQPPTVSDPTSGVVYHGNLSSQVESFLNIRFAEDTSGQNRFAPPKAYSYPNGAVVDASQTGAACPQASISNLFVSPVTVISEDCLTLRVDRIENTTSKSNLPVMVYIYGGGFTSGQIYDKAYNPTGLLKAAAGNDIPVIYAAMNYRVGMFGFASSAALEAADSVNAGLLDQRLGLEWIKNNIQKFGGNPNNITIFGESAGGMSIGYQLSAYGGKGKAPFHRAILESGGATTISGTVGNLSTLHTSLVAKQVNCSTSNSSEELACLRAVPLATLSGTISKFEYALNPEALYVWQPVAPSAFIPEAPSKLLKSGQYYQGIDIIAGWNENDGSIFVSPNATSTAEMIYSVTYPGFLDNATSETLLSLYPLSSFSPMVDGNKTIPAQFFQASQMFRDNSFTCPAVLFAQLTAMQNKSATTNYLFANNQTVLTATFAKANDQYYGVSHGSDVPFVFNEVSAYPAVSTSEIQLAEEVSTSWALFANIGKPVAPAGARIESLTNWPQGFPSSGSGSVRIFGGPHDGPATLGSGGVLASEDLVKRCAFWNSDEVFRQLGK